MPELPTALPPAERTIGQFIGETIRTYSAHFWRAIPLGIPLAAADQLSVHEAPRIQILIFWALGPLVVAAYLWASCIVYQVRPALTPYLVGLLIYAPFPILRAAFFLPGIAWFALIGLAVPARSSNGSGSARPSSAAGSSAQPTTSTRSARWLRS
jgi:hypothetical protein